MAFLEVNRVTKRFEGITAVAALSLTINEGDIVCLLGPSGCGKTTLLRLIAGLEQLDSGKVLFAGRDITSIPPHLRGFGMMFQDFALFPHKDVFGNVAFGLQMRGDEATSVNARVTEMLALVDLAGFEKRDISQLSGGEQQRVALARALAPGPRLLLLDEPLGALDRALRERLMLELRQILKEVGVTDVSVTHDQTEAFAIADRIAVMNAGQIEQISTPQTLYHQPQTPFVARFLGFHNVLDGVVVSQNVVETGIGRLSIAASLPDVGQAVQVLIRPDGACLGGDVVGVVTAVSFRGRYSQVWVQVGAHELMFEVGETAAWVVGHTVALTLSDDALILL
jgi:ABC-type Fe3+/spermidine/putrescine transport system ATPase subunit